MVLRHKYIPVISFMLFCSFLSFHCSSSSDKEKQEIKKIDETPPGTMKIVGTVEKIFKDRLSDNSKSPCSKIPCYAQLKIEKILGRGHSVHATVSSGKVVDVNFAFTTGKADKKLFPNSNVDLPGIKAGDKIEASMSIISKDNPDTTFFTITTYQITN